MPVPLIINFTPTGAVPTREMNPHVPLSVAELVEDVRRACELGITLVHLHARDEAGRPTLDPEIYGAMIRQIRSFAPELVICVSLTGRDDPDPENRVAPLRLEGDAMPDMGSLTLGSLNFPGQASCNPPNLIHRLATQMRERRILPELEIFDLGMANFARYLARKGVLAGPHYANVILGNIGSAQLDASHLGLLLRDLPENTTWALGGIGRFQLPANLLGLALDGGVRVGLEDNLYWEMADRTPATNLALLERIHALARHAGRPVMSSADFRARLGLAPGRGRYGLADQ